MQQIEQGLNDKLDTLTLELAKAGRKSAEADLSEKKPR